MAWSSRISKLGKTTPQLHVTGPCPTRGILVGLVRGPPPLILFPGVTGLLGKLRELGPKGLDMDVTGLWCWAANWRAAAAMAAGGNRPPIISPEGAGKAPGKPGKEGLGNALVKSLLAGLLTGIGLLVVNPLLLTMGGLIGGLRAGG